MKLRIVESLVFVAHDKPDSLITEMEIISDNGGLHSLRTSNYFYVLFLNTKIFSNPEVWNDYKEIVEEVKKLYFDYCTDQEIEGITKWKTMELNEEEFLDGEEE